MIGYIYKTTNVVNNKVYIGKKESETYDPKYYGSGKLIKLAIKKYGVDNFVNEIIDTADTIEELNKKEIHYISIYKETFGEDCYNIATGGTGGNVMKYMSEEEKKQFSDKMRVINKERCSTEEFKKRISKASKERFSNPDEREKQRQRLIEVWKDEELLKRHSQIQKKAHENPERKAKILISNKKRWDKPNARIEFKEAMNRVWTDEKKQQQSELIKSKITDERRAEMSANSKKLWEKEEHRKYMSERMRMLRMNEEINKGAEARRIKILLKHHEEEKVFNSRVEFETYCEEMYGYIFSNKTYKKLITTGEPFKSYYKKQSHMNGIIIKKID